MTRGTGAGRATTRSSVREINLLDVETPPFDQTCQFTRQGFKIDWSTNARLFSIEGQVSSGIVFAAGKRDRICRPRSRSGGSPESTFWRAKTSRRVHGWLIPLTRLSSNGSSSSVGNSCWWRETSRPRLLNLKASITTGSGSGTSPLCSESCPPTNHFARGVDRRPQLRRRERSKDSGAA